MQTTTLVVRLGSLGDVILTSATVLSLKIAYPGSRLTFLTKESFRPIVEMFDGVDEVVTIPNHASAAEIVRLGLELDGARFDRVIDLHGNFRSWLVRSLIVSNQRVYYPKQRLARWRMTFSRKSPVADYRHTVDLYNDTLVALGHRPVCRRPILHPPSRTKKQAELLAADSPLVVVAPGAAHANKAWPVDNFVAVARQLVENNGVRVLFAVTSDDPAHGAVASIMGDEQLIPLVDYPLAELATLIQAADLMIANDSGIAHLASAVGTATLAIFGPTHPALGFAPRGLRDEVAEVDESCRPCSRHGKKACYRDQRYCFTQVTPNQVAERATRMLVSARNLTPALFVDRDGTLIKNKHYLSDPDGVELITGAAPAIIKAHEKGYRVVVVSNQSGVARGYHSIEDVERVNARMLELLAAEGAAIDAVYYCPHHARHGRLRQFRIECECRKPGAGMGEAAALGLGLDLRSSFVVGDSLADINFGRVIGATPILVSTGHGTKTQAEASADLKRSGISIVNDIEEAVGLLWP